MVFLGQILIIATIGVAIGGVVTLCRLNFIECVKWRRSCGRTNFWPLIR